MGKKGPFFGGLMLILGIGYSLMPEALANWSAGASLGWPIPYDNEQVSTLVVLHPSQRLTEGMAPDLYTFGETQQMTLPEAFDLPHATEIILSPQTRWLPLIQKTLQTRPVKRVVIVDDDEGCDHGLSADQQDVYLDQKAQSLRRTADLLHDQFPDLRIDLHLRQPHGQMIPIPHPYSWTHSEEVSLP